MPIDDNQKIGIGLICLGFLFMFIGILFFFDTALIAIGILFIQIMPLYVKILLGNILFLSGLCFSIGFQRTWKLFSRYHSIRQ